jgi:hypothetical protein
MNSVLPEYGCSMVNPRWRILDEIIPSVGHSDCSHQLCDQHRVIGLPVKTENSMQSWYGAMQIS